MINQEILSKAIEKAIVGGYDFPYANAMKLRKQQLLYGSSWIYSVIYSPDFAKALWGEDTELGNEIECDNCSLETIDYWPAWQFHLQHMVIADDPIKYLGDNI